MQRPGDDDHYDPNQPRVPKGYAGGGRWTDGDDEGEPSSRSSEASTGRSGGSGDQFLDQETGTVVRSEFATPGSKGWDQRRTATLKDGTNFTYEKSGPFHRIYENGHLIGTFRWTENGLIAEPTLQLARRPPGRPDKIEDRVAAALAIYRALMARNWRQGGDVVGMAFNVEEMLKGERGEGPAAVPISLTRKDLEACERYPEANDILKDAVDEVRVAEGPMSAQQFGAAVHKIFAHRIRQMRDKNFVSEYSVLKAAEENPGAPMKQIVTEAHYGMGGTLRADAIENVKGEGKLYCVYDPKTGKAGLTMPRMAEMARSVGKHFNHLGWIYVFEMPFRR
ncbi:MAG TPA: hypothetical protein VFO36_01570 [Nitrospiraceae bacterium]|nr:hypothetical protein [Nitrospiraceae bacterium]